MRKFLIFIAALLFPVIAFAQLTTVQGGTGTSSPSGILYGTTGNSHLHTVIIGSNLTFSAGTLSATGGSGGSGNVSTSTGETSGQIAYWTSTNGTPALLGKVATGTISAGSSAITVTANRAAIGGALSIDCAAASGSQNGCLSSTDWTTFNGKLSANQSITLSGDVTGSGATAITTAFNLGNTHWWTARQNFTNATTSQFTATSSLWFTGVTASSLLALDNNNQVIASSTIGWNLLKGPASSIFAFDSSGNPAATTSIGANYITGQLITVNGTSFNRGDSKTITAASSSLLGDNNTFSASTTFQAQINAQGASTTLLSFSTGWDTGITSALVSVDSNHKMSAYGGASACSANNFVTALSALGATTCGTASISGVNLGSNLFSLSNDGTTLSGSSYNGSAAISNWAINLTAQNIWTGASTTFTGGVTIGTATTTSATTTNFGFTGLKDAILSTNHSGVVVATTSIGNNYLAASGVSGSSCTNCNLSYNSNGIITVAANGSAGGGGSGSVGTSSAETANFIPWWTSTNGTPALQSGGTNLFQFLNTQGSLLLGTSTAQYGVLTVGSSTKPQILLSDNTTADNLWALRNYGGILSLATSTATATSSVSAFTLDANGFLTIPAVKSAVELADSNGKLTAYAGSAPCTNQVALSLSATGVITCTSVTNAMLSNSTISGVALGNNLAAHTTNTSLSGTSYNGSAAVSDWGINLSHANSWAAIQTFDNHGIILSATTSALLGTNSAGQIVATTSVGVNYLTGVLPTANGGTGSSGLGTGAVSASSNVLSAGTLSIANGGTATTTGGVTNGVEYFYGGTLTNDALFTHATSTGQVLMGTTTPGWGLLTVATSSVPQLSLSDGIAADVEWVLRSVGNSLFIATSTPTATSSVSALQFNNNGIGSLAIGSTTQTFSAVVGLLTLGSNGSAGTSTISAGKIQIDGYSNTGGRVCIFVVGTTLTVGSGACTP